jgi:hypothetical protein
MTRGASFSSYTAVVTAAQDVRLCLRASRRRGYFHLTKRVKNGT